MAVMRVRRARVLDEFPAGVGDAWEESFLSGLSDATVERLLADARIVHLEAGKIFYRGSFHQETEALGLIVAGLVRAFRKSPDGRELTLRYASPGEIMGVAATWVTDAAGTSPERFRMLGGESVYAEAIRESTVLKLRPARLRAAAHDDPELASALAVNLAERLLDAQTTLASYVFLPVRCRLASHLLNLAQREAPYLVVRNNHQSLADAVGSAREVVSRTLKSMEHDGLVERVGGPSGYLRLVDPARLHRLTMSAEEHKPCSSMSGRGAGSGENSPSDDGEGDTRIEPVPVHVSDHRRAGH